MDHQWRDNQPIYRQLRDRIAALVIDESLGDGDALPSVREVAAEYQVNPLTVLKGYQLLVDEGLVESRRGRGMFVIKGARARLLKLLRAQFIADEWPQIVQTVERLGLDWDELLTYARNNTKGDENV